jgi:GNAT superfamily N-acetyltransferase
MSLKIIPFREDFIPQAAVLLAAQHKRNRLVMPELPDRFEDPAAARAAIKAALKRKNASGFAALEDGRLVAYLIGDMVIDDVWGRSGWVRIPGCAYDPGVGVGPILDLYALLGARWVANGTFSHYTLAPVSDPDLVHAWFSLSFGIEQIHALADLEALMPEKPTLPKGLEIRQAKVEDSAALAAMSDVVWRYQMSAPVWAAMLPELAGDYEEGWAELPEDPEATVWVALLDGELAGMQGYWPSEAGDDGLLVPEQCTNLLVGGTREGFRGRGIGTLLTAHGLHHAREAGFRYCETDWRSTNLLSSRFWPRQGFRPVAYRLARSIDRRAVWEGDTPS